MTIPPWPQAGERERELIEEILRSDRWGGFHPIVAGFEQQFAASQGCPFGVSAINGTVTLEMILEAMGIGKGDEVILPAISFVSTATAVSRVGALPVFVDIERDTFQIDPTCAERAITLRTRAIMAVHFGGSMADMDALCRLGIPIIEDAAHAHGSEWRGRRAGSIGIAGSFSFQNSKVMTAGEGGIITTADPDLATRVWEIANQGRRKDGGWFEHYTLGTNFRMTAFQAAVLIAQLERLPEQNRHRARNAAIIRQACPEIGWQRVPEAADLQTNYLLLGRVRNRDRFHQKLISRGIPCTPFYPHTLYENPLYREGGCRVEPCPIAEQSIRDTFWLPHRVLLGSEENTRKVAEIVVESVNG